jgi:hypothetical protein
MAVVSVTRVRVRSWRYLPAFLYRSTRSGAQAARSGGNLGVRLLADRGSAFWTTTSWESVEAMREFARAGVHGDTMRKLLEWCDEAALVHWTQAEGTLPSWEEAHRRLLAEGRTSKVNHPSEAQAAFRIPAPVVGTLRERRMK